MHGIVVLCEAVGRTRGEYDHKRRKLFRIDLQNNVSHAQTDVVEFFPFDNQLLYYSLCQESFIMNLSHSIL